jgi:hypothetical protein
MQQPNQSSAPGQNLQAQNQNDQQQQQQVPQLLNVPQLALF